MSGRSSKKRGECSVFFSSGPFSILVYGGKIQARQFFLPGHRDHGVEQAVHVALVEWEVVGQCELIMHVVTQACQACADEVGCPNPTDDVQEVFGRAAIPGVALLDVETILVVPRPDLPGLVVVADDVTGQITNWKPDAPRQDEAPDPLTLVRGVQKAILDAESEGW